MLTFLEYASKHILKTIKILLLMVHVHNAPSNPANLASGEIAFATRAHNLFQNNGKRNLFSQMGPKMMPKRIGYNISTIIVFICTCRRQDN